MSSPLSQISSSSVTHTPTPTAPALALRKLPFSFWPLPSFINFPLQCKAGKYRLCLGSSSCGHVYQKPCCKPVKGEGSLVELITTILPCVNKEAICNLSYFGPSFAPETQRVRDHHVQHPPSISVPSTAHKVIYHVLEP